MNGAGIMEIPKCRECLYADKHNTCMHKDGSQCQLSRKRPYWSPKQKNKLSPSLQRIIKSWEVYADEKATD